MWCTRWFLPLLLLPLPTAPPFFLLLFLISLTIHAKPCFYCIVLLTTLFISTCYWQPFPIDTPLSTPWADNITNFAEALNATLMPNYTRPLPTVMRVADRCWCDFAAGGLFQPFNVSHWEYTSVRKYAQSLEREQFLEDVHLEEEYQARKRAEPETFLLTAEEDNDEPESTLPAAPTETLSTVPGFWSRIRQLADKAQLSSLKPPTENATPLPTPTKADMPLLRETRQPNMPIQVPLTGDSSLFGREYDLREYGLGMIVDLRWTR